MLLFVIVFVTVFFNLNQKRTREGEEKRKVQEARVIELERSRKATEDAIAEMVSRSAAVDDWEERLMPKDLLGLNPVLTIDIEKLWLVDKPILFYGSIKDVVSGEEGRCVLLIEEVSGGNEGFHEADLELSLRCPCEKIQSLLKEDVGKSYGSFSMMSGVALTARIERIRRKDFQTAEGIENVRIGEGEIVDVLWTGNVR
jgi:hypothetical protein